MRSFTHGALTEPKSGRGRVVPMAPEVATALARLLQRDRFTSPDDLVFPGIAGSFFDESALRRRYKAAQAGAGLRRLRLHDLRHTFASTVISHADPVEVQEWAGHADLGTTKRYLHYRDRGDAAKRIAAAFAVKQPEVEPVQVKA
jgi:integrase